MTLAAIEALQSLRALLIEDPKLCVEVPDPRTVNIFKTSRDQEIALVDLALAELLGKPEGWEGSDTAMLYEQAAGLPGPALRAVSTGEDPR